MKPLYLLLIHGFGGSRQEVRPLAEQLERRGFTVGMAQLAGHGATEKHIDNISYRQWVDSVRTQVRLLSPHHRVVPIGFSMGGLIAAVLNSEQPFERMVFINTPIYFWNLPQILTNLCTDFKKAWRYYCCSATRVTPYASLQFLRLLLHARGLFRQVGCAALVVQAQDDESVWPASAGFICKELRQPPVLYRAPVGGHQVLGNPGECAIIADKIAALCGEG